MSAAFTDSLGLAADHAGFELKEALWDRLDALDSIRLSDFGARSQDAEDDYPDVVVPLSQAVSRGEVARGLAICGSGVGASIAANKVRGVRAAVIHDTFSAHQGVEDDDVNVLCLGAKVVGLEVAWEIVLTFLDACFSEESRHRRRLDKVARLEDA